ncbi:MAG: hypothetical protein Q9173_007186, partial [Seirophora scorigena]
TPARAGITGIARVFHAHLILARALQVRKASADGTVELDAEAWAVGDEAAGEVVGVRDAVLVGGAGGHAE